MTSPSTTRSNLFSSRGFSLVELIIYSAILGSLLLILARYYTEISRLKIFQTREAALYQNGSRLLFDVQQTIRKAQQIDLPLKNETTSLLSLDSGAVIYQLSDNALTKTENGETNELNDQGVKVIFVSFRQLGPSSLNPTLEIKIILQGQLNPDSHERSVTFQTAVTLP
ncbi:MAG: prepilin-type N-terminal cleavage/methylation domain-containing protein [Candidatus Shapirobacteria bacterium]